MKLSNIVLLGLTATTFLFPLKVVANNATETKKECYTFKNDKSNKVLQNGECTVNGGMGAGGYWVNIIFKNKQYVFEYSNEETETGYNRSVKTLTKTSKNDITDDFMLCNTDFDKNIDICYTEKDFATPTSATAKIIPKTDYKLNGCTTKANINKNYCKDDVIELDKVLKKASEIKPNFNENKKLIQLFYKNKENRMISDIFVVDEKSKQIYLKPDYTVFSDDSVKKHNYKKAPYIITTKNSDAFCLYQDGAKFNIDSTAIIEKRGTKYDLVCSFFDTELDGNFNHSDVFVYEEYTQMFELRGKKDISWLK